MAAPFDARRLAVTGAARARRRDAADGHGSRNITSPPLNPRLSLRRAGAESPLAWVARDGIEQLLPAPPRNYQFPRISPDRARIAVSIADEDSQIWIYDIAQDTLRRLTFDGGNMAMAWSPDGRQIVYRSYPDEDEGYQLNLQASDGAVPGNGWRQ
jgi:hypothetical protein